MFNIEWSGLEEFSNELDKLAKNADKLDGEHEVPLDELFTPSFMAQNTNYSSFDELLDKSGFTVNTQADFEAIPDKEFDEYIAKTTVFNNWEEMQGKAAEEYIERKLFE